MYLVDTNIFLEILLNQKKQRKCRGFLTKASADLFISDFALHSIGIILFKVQKTGVFRKFALDVLSKLEIVSLRKSGYDELSAIARKFDLDFDDAYQCLIAKDRHLMIVTLDQHFKKVSEEIKVLFL